MSDYNAAIWKLSVFCGKYGRIVPVNEDSNGLMRRFHTSTRNEDIEDLYVIGHGEAEEDYRGSVFYSKYTLFTGEQIKQLNWKTIKYVGMHAWGTLQDCGQAVIINKNDYFNANE